MKRVPLIESEAMHKYVKHGKGRTNDFDLAHWITNGERFTNSGNTFWGRTSDVITPDSWGAFGQLPEDWKRTLRARWEHVTYVVFSYQTPIAWFDNDANAWIVPEHTYSVTTTRHQFAVSYALSKTLFEVRNA